MFANLLSVVNEVICLRAKLSLNFLPIQLQIAYLKCADFFSRIRTCRVLYMFKFRFKFSSVSIAKHEKQIVMTHMYGIGAGYVCIVVID